MSRPLPHDRLAGPPQRFALGSFVLLVTVVAVALAMTRPALTRRPTEVQAAAMTLGGLLGAAVGGALLTRELHSRLTSAFCGALLGGGIGFMSLAPVDLVATLSGCAVIVVTAWIVRPRKGADDRPASPWHEPPADDQVP